MGSLSHDARSHNHSGYTLFRDPLLSTADQASTDAATSVLARNDEASDLSKGPRRKMVSDTHVYPTDDPVRHGRNVDSMCRRTGHHIDSVSHQIYWCGVTQLRAELGCNFSVCDRDLADTKRVTRSGVLLHFGQRFTLHSILQFSIAQNSRCVLIPGLTTFRPRPTPAQRTSHARSPNHHGI